MASTLKNRKLSITMERTDQWVFSQEVPTDVVVQVDDVEFKLHKFMLIAKCGAIRRLLTRSEKADLDRINLTDFPGGAEIFEKAAKFCYGVNFELNLYNVAALRCAAEYLEMSEECCEGNLTGRTEKFLSVIALTNLSNTAAVLRSCEMLLPVAEDLKIIQKCLEYICKTVISESHSPTRSPPDWWTQELTILNIGSFSKLISSLKIRGARPQTLAAAITVYAETSLHELVGDHTGNLAIPLDHSDVNIRSRQKNLLESIVSLFPPEKYVFHINFLCCLLRAATFLIASAKTKSDLESRITALLDRASVGDLLLLSFTYDGEKLFDLESVKRIVGGFVERERDLGGHKGDFRVCSSAMQRVMKTVDDYLAEIATVGELSISKFTGIANLIPKSARKIEDDLYRAVDIYLKAHPSLDEIEREKVCSAMDPLCLSKEARHHASQNKRLPVNIVLHAVYYDQLKIRSSSATDRLPEALTARNQAVADVELIIENEALKKELETMKSRVSDLQKNQGGSGVAGTSNTSKGTRTFLTSVSKTLGKLNPFKKGSKDTSNVDDKMETPKYPRRRRFSIS